MAFSDPVIEPPVVVMSATESRRFDRPVGRLVLDGDGNLEIAQISAALSNTESDVVILRYPNRSASLFSQLMSLADFDVLFADCLVYWQRDLPEGLVLPLQTPGSSVRAALADQVEEMVRSVFADYPNHYAANPLFEATAILDGYVEWVGDLIDANKAECVVLVDPDDQTAGFSVIDFSVEIPDIKLAGITPSHRGQGRYSDLIRASMNAVAVAGRPRITISTQAHNVAVMSTWARLGWTPTKSVTTVHLVRRGLLHH